MRKPDGQYAIMGEHSAISRFVDPLPIRKVPGIGKVSSVSLLDHPETWNATSTMSFTTTPADPSVCLGMAACRNQSQHHPPSHFHDVAVML